MVTPTTIMHTIQHIITRLLSCVPRGIHISSCPCSRFRRLESTSHAIPPGNHPPSPRYCCIGLTCFAAISARSAVCVSKRERASERPCRKSGWESFGPLLVSVAQARAAPMAATETHYDVLGVHKEATVEEIRRVRWR